MGGKNTKRDDEIARMGFENRAVKTDDGKLVPHQILTCCICGTTKHYRSDKMYAADYLRRAATKAGWSWHKGKPVCGDVAKHKVASPRWTASLDPATRHGGHVTLAQTPEPWGVPPLADQFMPVGSTPAMLPSTPTEAQIEAFVRADHPHPIGFYPKPEAVQVDVAGSWKPIPGGGKRPISIAGHGGAWRGHPHSRHNPEFRAKAIAAIERGLSNVDAAIEIGCSDNVIRAVRLAEGYPQADVIRANKSKGQTVTTTPTTSPTPTLPQSPTPVSVSPREMVSIIEKIDAFYDIGGKRWRAPWNDQKIGEALSLPAAKVAYVRKDLHGDLAADPELVAIRAEVDSLREMLGTLELRLRAAEKASSGGNIR
jgi:hypothetical protein